MKVEPTSPLRLAASQASPGVHKTPDGPPKDAPAKDPDPATSADDENYDIGRDLSLFARVLRPVEGGRIVVILSIAWTLITVVSMFGQVRFNKWYGQFFDAINSKNLDAFIGTLWIFLPLVFGMLALTVGQRFLQERLKFRIREWISRDLLTAWLKPMRMYQMSFLGEAGHNPDQRIQEDTRLIGDSTADLCCGVISSTLQFIAFIGVLWSLSTTLTFPIGDHVLSIPRYMVWCALAYAVIGSGLTWLVGSPLIRLNGERYAREAELRFALVRANESAESIALHGGEKDEHKHLDGALVSVVDVMRRISTSLAQLTWITSGTGWLPMVVAAPIYFKGDLTLGNLMMVTGAFGSVQGSLRWFVDNFSRLADWRAAIHRVDLVPRGCRFVALGLRHDQDAAPGRHDLHASAALFAAGHVALCVVIPRGND